MGAVYKHFGQYQTALTHYTEALSTNRAIGNKNGEVKHLTNIGNVHYCMAEYTEAQYVYKEALDKSRLVGNKETITILLGNLGMLHNHFGEFDQALSYYNEALTMAQSTGNKKYQCSHLGNIGLVYQKKGEYDSALSHFTRLSASHWRLATKDWRVFRLGMSVRFMHSEANTNKQKRCLRSRLPCPLTLETNDPRCAPRKFRRSVPTDEQISVGKGMP